MKGSVLLSVDHVHDIGVLAESLYQTLNLHPQFGHPDITKI